MFAFLLPFLPSLAVLRLYALGAGLVAVLAIAGWHQMTSSWTAWRDNRAGEAAVHAALDNAHEIARRQSQLATERAAAATAAHNQIEDLKRKLRDEQNTPPPTPADAAPVAAALQCPTERTPLSRVRILRAIVAGHGGKGG